MTKILAYKNSTVSSFIDDPEPESKAISVLSVLALAEFPSQSKATCL